MNTKTVSSVALATLAAPMLALSLLGSASAQGTSPAPSTTAAPGPALERIVTPGGLAVTQNPRSTQLAANLPATTGSAWDIITKDASLTEFAALVKATATESLFFRVDGSFTYLLPTNDAFRVLDQTQLARLKEPRYKDQAAAVVRQHVLVGRAGYVEFTRGLPTGVPRTGPATTVPDRRVDSVTTESGKVMSVRTTVITDRVGSANRFAIVVGSGGLIEIADYPVRNGLAHTTETLQMPAPFNSITDIVGRR